MLVPSSTTVLRAPTKRLYCAFIFGKVVEELYYWHAFYYSFDANIAYLETKKQKTLFLRIAVHVNLNQGIEPIKQR